MPQNPNAMKRELEALRIELKELKSRLAELEPTGTSREVKVSTTGPRRAGVLVEGQAIELQGEGSQTGMRTIELQSPDIEIVLGTKGRIGTKVVMEVEINAKKKKEEFWMELEVESRDLRYPFSDFGL